MKQYWINIQASTGNPHNFFVKPFSQQNIVTAFDLNKRKKKEHESYQFVNIALHERQPEKEVL